MPTWTPSSLARAVSRTTSASPITKMHSVVITLMQQNNLLSCALTSVSRLPRRRTCWNRLRWPNWQLKTIAASPPKFASAVKTYKTLRSRISYWMLVWRRKRKSIDRSGSMRRIRSRRQSSPRSRMISSRIRGRPSLKLLSWTWSSRISMTRRIRL